MSASVQIDPALLEIIVCPDCHGTLAVDEEASELVCTACGLAYPVRDDIPVLLVEEARRPSPPVPSPDGETAGDA